MKGLYQKLALLAGIALLIVVAAYYLTTGSRDTTGAPKEPRSADSRAPGDQTAPPPADSNAAGDQATGAFAAPGPARSLAAVPQSPGGAPAAGTELAQGGPMGDNGTQGNFPIPASAPATQAYAATAPAGTADETITTPPASTPRTYTIKAGDTFSSIAQQLYHSGARAREIAQANPLVDPIKLKVGQVIKLPGAAALEAAEPHHGTRASAGDAAEGTPGATPGKAARAVPATYTVKAGDTLSTIARAVYHDRAMWKLIYQVNRKVIGSSPSDLAAGMKLVLPAAPHKTAHAAVAAAAPATQAAGDENK